MTKDQGNKEPTNVQRAEWARESLAVFTFLTYSGNHPSSMHPDDLESAIGDLICDLMHFANFHPRLDAVAIHTQGRSMFELEVAEEQKADGIGALGPKCIDALIDIKCLADKSGDHEADPWTLLDLIADRVHAALAEAKDR